MVKTRFIPFVLFAALAGVLLWALLDTGRDPRKIPTPLLGKPVPDFKLPLLYKPEQIVDNGLLQGKATLMNVWGSWCVVCVREHPFLTKLSEQGVRLIGINYGDERESVLEWLAKHGNPYESIIVDGDGSFGIDLGVYGAPETYLVDKKGVIRYKYVGPIDDDLWREEIEPLYLKIVNGEE